MFFVCCLVCLCACLFICALWSPAGKKLTSALRPHFPILGQVWYLIVSIPDLCTITYFAYHMTSRVICILIDKSLVNGRGQIKWP